MNRAEKQAEIQSLQERFATDELFVVTQNQGLTVAQMTKLRNDLRANGASFKVAKNTLARRAAKGTKFEGLTDMLKGPTGLASSKDVIAAAKTAYEFSKTNEKLVIIGGALGTQILDAKAIEALAKLPSLDELRSKLVGLLQAPATKIARVLQAPAQGLVGVTRAYGEKV
ncbi:MAG: 50S ribosomal protein L10 [Alphaproteobacteria bacterium]